METQGQTEFRFADRELLASLVALLPEWAVSVQDGVSGPVCLYVRQLVADMLETALCEGWTIDRTNGEGELASWDGWLVIQSPKPRFLQIAQPGGKPLEDLT